MLTLGQKMALALNVSPKECTTTVTQLLYIHIHFVAIEACTLHSEMPVPQ